MTLPSGFAIGHWTDEAGRTGCTVVLAPAGAVTGVDVRGAAPGTLGTDTMRPGNLVERGHAVLLTGGSAFGLDAAGGVMRYLEEHGIGYELGGVRVPIVAGAVIFDLLVGSHRARPDHAAGYAACAAASDDPATGAVGAGTGATVAKAGDPSQIRPGGVGLATTRVGTATVTAIMVVNAVGGIWDDDRHEWVAELTIPEHGVEATRSEDEVETPASEDGAESAPGQNTVIGAVLTDAELSKLQATRLATVAHDGIARAVRPAHTMYDGDAIFCLAGGTARASYDAVEATATVLVARAIAGGVRAAQPSGLHDHHRG